jgi:hypothetical protein
LFFAAFGLSSGLWVWYFVPETKQVPSVYLLRYKEGLELISRFVLHGLSLIPYLLVRLGHARNWRIEIEANPWNKWTRYSRALRGGWTS